jgi:UDP-N-acetylmuramate--alanine ligase
MIATRLPLNLGPIHFIGIGGIGMSGIAEVLINLGYSIQGSDIKSTYITNRLSSLGVKIFYEHVGENIGNCSVVVVSSAIKKNNLELISAKDQGVPIVSRAEMLAELMRMKLNIVVAGSHGKTTTTSLVASIAEGGNLDPTVINGGVIKAYGSNARLGEGDWMIVEADESDGSFNRLPVTVAIVTNIDREHLDYYSNFSNLKKAFENFISSVPFYGIAICCIDDEHVEKVISNVNDRKIITYGFSEDADVTIRNLKISDQGTSFDLDNKLSNIYLRDFRLPMIGHHNALNACAAILAASNLSIPIKLVRNALADFEGVSRRFTRVGFFNGAMIIDDYAHHPAEIEAVIAAAKEIAQKRIIVVHQPHRYSRLKLLFSDFKTCFKDADILGITPVFSAGEKEIDGFDGKNLIKSIRVIESQKIEYVEDEYSFSQFLIKNCNKGDIFLALGAGSITNWVNSQVGIKDKIDNEYN